MENQLLSERPDDAQWVLEAREGSELAMTHLVQAHIQHLIRYIRCIIGDEADAEEVAQMSFVRAFKKLEDLNNPASFRNWLWKIGRCAALDHRRQVIRRAGLPVETVSTENLDKTPSEEQSVDLFFQRESLNERTRLVLNKLPEASRELLDLRYGEGLTLREIGDRTGLKIVTIKARLARLRKHLRPRLGSLAQEWKRLLDELP